MKVNNKSFFTAIVLGSALGIAPGLVHANDSRYDDWRYDERRVEGPHETARDAEGGFPFYEGAPGPHSDYDNDRETTTRDRDTMTRSEALELERALARSGYDPGVVDGLIDNDTRAAIREFQEDHELAATGIIDPETGELLGIVVFETS